MAVSSFVEVLIDPQRVRDNALALRARVGVPIIAVVKADCYGLGLPAIAPAIADVVDRFCVFSLAEVQAARLHELTSKPIMAIGPDEQATADDYQSLRVRPAVWTVQRARALRAARPILSVDTGMQRFAAPEEEVQAILDAGACDEAFTHAVRVDQAARLLELVGNRGLRLHAAATALLDEPAARLDAVRPGLALYRGAAHVSTRLIDVRDSRGPVGYTGFMTRRHGVIPAGYSHGIRPGPVVVNGRRTRIVETGMQTSFVEATEADHVGDQVTLLGDGLTEGDVARAWGSSEQQVLTQLCASGKRKWTADERR